MSAAALTTALALSTAVAFSEEDGFLAVASADTPAESRPQDASVGVLPATNASLAEELLKSPPRGLNGAFPQLPGVDPVVAQRIGVLIALIAVLGVALPIVGTEGSSKNAAPDGDYEGGGSLRRRTVQAGGRTREFNVVLPAHYHQGDAYPVIIAFGGWQHSAERSREYMRLESVARDAIIIYAQGINNAWGGAPYADTTVDNDIDFVRAAIDDVATNFGGERDHVAAIGLSNGGGMAAALACHAPELVKAVASAAGAYYDPTVSNCTSGDVATLLLHGTNDDVVGYFGGTRHGAHFQPVDRVFATFGRKNGCSTQLIETPGAFSTSFEPTSCLTPTRLERVDGGGHTWFTSPDATTESVNFVLNEL